MLIKVTSICGKKASLGIFYGNHNLRLLYLTRGATDLAQNQVSQPVMSDLRFHCFFAKFPFPLLIVLSSTQR